MSLFCSPPFIGPESHDTLKPKMCNIDTTPTASHKIQLDAYGPLNTNIRISLVQNTPYSLQKTWKM
jgi:hypothetical protein